MIVREKTQNLRRLEAQRNELNSKVRLLREELSLLQEPGSYVGEVVKRDGGGRRCSRRCTPTSTSWTSTRASTSRS